MQLREFYSFFLNELKALYDPHEASVITSMIFESVAGTSKSDIITHPDKEFNKEIVSQLEKALLQLKGFTPVQYIIGKAWFCNLSFIVSPAVLVPRPETEELVSLAINQIKNSDKKTILDIGTGTGCIPISIKKQLPDLLVSAMDYSKEALLVAKENGISHSTAIEWIYMNFLEENNWDKLAVYDVIISNPPYIPENEKLLLDKNVTSFEPHMALFVPDNQRLIFYEKIANFGKKHLSPDGSIFLETHELYAKEVVDLFKREGYDAEIKKDFYEKERIVIATRFR
jgi:release factor glutamine methyltransferase